MRPSIQHAFYYYFAAALEVVAVFGTSPASLRLSTLTRFVVELLAVVALPWPWSLLKRACCASFSACVEEAFWEEPPCVTFLGHVHHHRSVRLGGASLAWKRNLSDCRSILFSLSFCCSRCNLIYLVQHCCSLDVVGLDWVELIAQYARAGANLLCCSLDYLVLIFVSARNPGPALRRVVDGDCLASLVFLVLYCARLFLQGCSD